MKNGKRLRWKKGRDYSGLMRLAETYDLRCGGEELATAQKMDDDQWFWYGLDQNTAHRPDTLENVKAEAEAAARRSMTQ